MRNILIAAASAALASTAVAAPVPVRLTGMSQADEALRKDILQNVTMFGVAFDCPAPSEVQTSIITAARIPSAANYRAPSDKASYEEWKANFCGRTESFLISFWPDPNGGSFLNVTYPYPEGAPRGGR
jgi:hypothetical protein